MGLEAGGRGGAEEKKEEEKKKEKIPHMCESIGHRPLWGRCPKRTDQKEPDKTREKKQTKNSQTKQ